MTDLDTHYRRWNQDEIVTRFADKTAADFFECERRLLEPVAPDIADVIDIGCASGRFVEFLTKLGAPLRSFTGIDLSPASISRARDTYPEHAFHCANALEFAPGAKANLVNATGVMQHEPRFAELVGRMIEWSSRYVMFDAKFAQIDDHLADIDRARISCDPPLYFVLFALDRFLDDLAARTDIVHAKVYGYETPLNRNAVVPDEIGPVVSAGVLLTCGEPGPGGPRIECALPASFGTGRGQNG
ncbi:MAG: methyltransferase domain-containing protein [Alphaproteobacteria bacterium]|nr:methyltransferase domain-containing protein [Alphaproteobacteria bacterium]